MKGNPQIMVHDFVKITFASVFLTPNSNVLKEILCKIKPGSHSFVLVYYFLSAHLNLASEKTLILESYSAKNMLKKEMRITRQLRQ